MTAKSLKFFTLLLSIVITIPSCFYKKKYQRSVITKSIQQPVLPEYTYYIVIQGVECSVCAHAVETLIKEIYTDCTMTYSFDSENMYINYTAHEQLNSKLLATSLQKEEFSVQSFCGPLTGEFTVQDGARIFVLKNNSGDNSATYYVAQQRDIPLSINNAAWGLLPRSSTTIMGYVWYDTASKAYWLSVEPETNFCNAG